MGSVFAYAGTAFGKLSSFKTFTHLSMLARIRQSIMKAVLLTGPTAVGVAIGVKVYGNPNDLASLIKDGEKYSGDLEHLRQDLLVPCPT